MAGEDACGSTDNPTLPSHPTGPPRPLGLTLLMWLYAFWAVAAVLVLGMTAVGAGEVAVEGRPVGRETALEVALPVFLPLALALAGGALALWLEMPWARSALLLPLALAAVLPALVAAPAGHDPARRIITGIGIMCVPALVLAGYLYARGNVRRYYRAIGDRRGGAEADVVD